MGINIWVIFASLLLVSARARRYDHGPHTFYDFSTGLATAGPYGPRELILYLTPDQVRSLEADGAVVKSDKDDGNDSELSAEQQANDEQDDENDDAQEDEEEIDDSQEENSDSEEEEDNDDSRAEDAQQGEESPEEKKRKNIDFEAILRLLNEEQVDDEQVAKEQPSNEPQNEAEISEEPRSFSPRFIFRQQEHEQKNLALAAAKKEQIFKTYSNLRYQPYGQRQRFNYQLRQQDYEARTPEEFDEKLIGTAIQGTKKFKLVPYKIEEPVDEPALTIDSQQQNSEAEKEVQTAVTSKLLRNELQKYAIRVQNRKNSEKTRAAARGNSKATAVPVLIKQQQSRKQSKTGKTPARTVDYKQMKPQQPKSIAVPVMVNEKSVVQKPIKIPVETNKLVSNKPYISTRKVTGNKKQNPEEAQKNNPERITILRQVWG